MKNNNRDIHYWYIIGILTMIIISLLSFRYAPDIALANYVSFAATIASLILATLAIIQGFISSNSFSQTVQNLNNSSSKIIDNSDKLSEIVSNLDNKFNEIPILIKGLEEKVITSNKTSNPVETSNSPTPKLSKEQITRLISNSSPVGLLTLYMAIKSYETKKNIIFEDKFNMPFTISIQYNFGYLVACHGIGVVNIKILSDIPKEIAITDIDKNLDCFETATSEYFKTKFGKGNLKSYEDAKKNIDNYFSASS